MAAMRTLTNNAIHNNAAWSSLAILDRAASRIASGEINQAMDDIFAGLRRTRDEMSAETWVEFARYVRESHELARWIYQDPMTRRAYEKPRGYAGDAVMMDYLYGIHGYHDAAAEASVLGREIYEYIRGCLAPSAVRHRREHIAQLIDMMAMDGSHPNILAVASGHLREAELSSALSSGHVGRFIALDADGESLRDVERHYAPLGVETVHGSVRHLLMRKIRLGTFDFVYAAGLYDYLGESTAQTLTARLFERLNPGGQLLIPNFAPRLLDRGYMEKFMDWTLVYRDEQAMVRLLAQVEPTQIQSYDVYDDPSGSVVYLLVKKRAQVC
jgi:extracellular factor (EF) 3-hydroxypalmitic acid methyl ester biosynthesis protein